MRLVSVTPGAAEQLPLQQQGILGWEARAAPSATLPSAFQSNCSKQRQREHWLDGIRIQRVTIISPFITPTGVCSCEIKYKADLKITHSHPSLTFFKVQLCSRGTAIVKVFVCMHVTEGAGEGWGRNLALDFMPGWLSLKSIKKKKSEISLWFLSY